MNLKFKSTIESLLNKKTTKLLNQVIDKTPITENINVEVENQVNASGPLQTDKYLELVELIKLNSKLAVKKQPSENLFTVKSVITVFAFLLTSILVQLDGALIDNKISSSEAIQLAVAFIGAVSVIAARGSEGNTGIYTPNGFIGLNKEDYDNDSILNKEDETPFG